MTENSENALILQTQSRPADDSDFCRANDAYRELTLDEKLRETLGETDQSAKS